MHPNCILICIHSRKEKGGTVLQTETTNAAEKLNLYGNSILRIAATYVKNKQDAEDILQDVLVKYMTKEPSFANDEHEKAWFLRVAINMAKNKCKSAAFRLHTSLEENVSSVDKYEYNSVLEAVYQLPTKYKEIIYLYYYEEYSVKEIAGLLHKKEATVKSLLRRGREKLSVVLKEDEESA